MLAFYLAQSSASVLPVSRLAFYVCVVGALGGGLVFAPQPLRVRRLAVAFVVALWLAVGIGVASVAADDDVVLVPPSECKGLTWTDPLWYLLGCYQF
jgi:hypothetical protein